MTDDNELIEKIEEQDKFLEKLTEQANRYGTVVDQDGDKLVLSIDGREYACNDTIGAQLGDLVLVHPESFQMFTISARAARGTLCQTLTRVDERQWVVQVDGDRRLVLAKPDLAIKVGDEVVVVANVITAVIPAPAALPPFNPVAWDDIGGNRIAKQELRSAITAIRGGSDIFAEYGLRPPRGVLFYGPPGCGKTLLGRAAATELQGDGNGAFIYVSGPQLLNMYVGESERNIRRLFATARDYRERFDAKSVLFIDEADAILQHRGSGRSSDMEKTIVPQFLTEMDGLGDSGTFVILATNRADTLDPAIIRDGRIDRRILVDRPDLDTSREIARIHFSKTRIREDADELANVAAIGIHASPLARAVSGAMLENVVERSKRAAIEREAGGKVLGITSNDVRHVIEDMKTETM